jgi:hypothetical protein
VKHDLEQNVAQLVAQVVKIAARNGVGDLIGLLDRIGRNAKSAPDPKGIRPGVRTPS